MTASVAAGLDWAGEGWLATFFEEKTYAGYAFKRSFDSLWEARELPEPVLVDIPIGLPTDSESLTAREELDSRARSETGRSSSVFPVPSREAARIAFEDDGSYEEVAEQNETDIDKGLSKQSYHITKTIGEVDAFLRQNDAAKQTIIESHPEVCFRALLDRDLKYGKTSAAGVGERLEALETLLDNPGKTLTEVTIALQGESAAIDLDDVLDAVVLGVTASMGEAAFDYLPSEDWRSDPEGLPMRMAYWGTEPLTE